MFSGKDSNSPKAFYDNNDIHIQLFGNFWQDDDQLNCWHQKTSREKNYNPSLNAKERSRKAAEHGM